MAKPDPTQAGPSIVAITPVGIVTLRVRVREKAIDCRDAASPACWLLHVEYVFHGATRKAVLEVAKRHATIDPYYAAAAKGQALRGVRLRADARWIE